MAPAMDNKLNSFKRSTSIALRPEQPEAEPASEAAAELAPTPQQLDYILSKELEALAGPQQASKLASFRRSTSIALRPEAMPEPVPMEEQPVPTPSQEEVDQILGQELQKLTKSDSAPKLSNFKRNSSIALRPEEPVAEPEIEQPALTPSVQELEALMEQDMKATA